MLTKKGAKRTLTLSKSMAGSEQGSLEKIEEANEVSSEGDIEINVDSRVSSLGVTPITKFAEFADQVERVPSFGDNLVDKFEKVKDTGGGNSPKSSSRRHDYSENSVSETSDFGMTEV